ncbi:MAG: serine/threonine-protein kinase, partial [Acidobacteriota bacterium]
MGQVFKARHRRLERIVAVKILPPNMVKNAATVARFEREVRAAARISHPNIVTAFDAGRAEGVHFLVMEYVEGSDLARTVKKNGPLPVERAVDYALQAARGLEAAHADGIVHRDIKPANLLVDANGTVKVLDLGLARFQSERDVAAEAALTSTGTVMGTVDYMAPELAVDTKSASAPADVYSLGCSLFYLLNGRAVYSGNTLMAKLLAHRDQPIPSLRALRPDVPESVEIVFRKMVAKRIEDRYQSMAEVIGALERCRSGRRPPIPKPQPVAPGGDSGLSDFLKDLSTAKPETPRPLNVPSRPIHRRAWLAGGAGVLGITALWGLGTWWTRDGSESTAETGGEREGTRKPERAAGSANRPPAAAP